MIKTEAKHFKNQCIQISIIIWVFLNLYWLHNVTQDGMLWINSSFSLANTRVLSTVVRVCSMLNWGMLARAAFQSAQPGIWTLFQTFLLRIQMKHLEWCNCLPHKCWSSEFYSTIYLCHMAVACTSRLSFLDFLEKCSVFLFFIEIPSVSLEKLFIRKNNNINGVC